MVIMGSSAGGLTLVLAMEQYPGFFKAGICAYGVLNLLNLAEETHKFEAHYLDRLIGPLPETIQIYRERSPIFAVENIRDALAIFHGEIDPVVPRRQSDELAASLKTRGVPFIYHIYPGEGHGFRKPETIKHFYRTVDKFLRQWVIAK
jgi:dipeptidyl aminopeptidase/acylaminoacyl peptidase